MHLRISRTKHGDRVYAYAQLVQSYRRPDGMPAHRVIASLGVLSDLEIANLRAALDASRKGGAVVLPPLVKAQARHTRVRANLHWLPIAVLRAVWQELGIDDLLDLRGEADMSEARVVEALVLHRALAPASKLAATRWFPTTALPELFGVPPSLFNNTRVHRALEALEATEPALQAALAPRLRSRCGAFLALFLDVTDTWFEGRGPEMAHKGRDKVGVYRRRVGVVLLCDHRGLPLRWRTLPGDYHDGTSMTELARELSTLDWTREVPLVMDRAMGRAGTVAFLAETGLRFLTALPVDEFESSGAAVPWAHTQDVALTLTSDSLQADLERAAAAAKAAGLTKVSDTRYVFDLGTFEKKGGPREAGASTPSRAVAAVRMAQRIAAEPDGDTASLAERFETSVRSVRRLRELGRLSESLQRRVLDGEADALTIDELRDIARAPASGQEDAFDAAVKRAPSTRPRTPTPRQRASGLALRVRGVVLFNPERFVDARATAERQAAELRALVDELNANLARPDCRIQDRTVARTVDAKLGKLGWHEVYTLTLRRLPEGGRRMELQRDDEAWRRRRRYDGFNVVVGHPDLPQTGAELVDLYFAKDAVEKDFQVIKSELELHPVRHRTDPKVRAHVTLCMLALLLERRLEERLAAAGQKRTAASALELLSTCHLNILDDDGTPFYVATEPTADQRAVVEALDLSHLLKDEVVRKLLTAR